MKSASQNQQSGFTLMELMIVIVIVGVIAAIAFPSYQNSVRESRRTEAKTALLEVMARQEQFFSENRAFAATFDELDLGDWGGATVNDFYRLNIAVDTATVTVDVTATAQGSQVEDLVNTYGISSNGRKFWISSVTKTSEPGWE